MSHQKQLQNQNDKKKQSIHDQAHARATTLVVVEREKEEKENRHTTNMVIAQVEGEFKARGFEVHLTKVTINRHVADGIIGMKPPLRGTVGLMPAHAFDLLVLAIKSCIQINQVNCIVLERQGIICAINKCCGIIVVADGGLKLGLFLWVMKATNVSLNVMIAWLIEERRVRWTTYNNLLKWFVGYWAFMLKYEFAQPGSNRDDEMIVGEANLHRILNVDKTKMSLDGSKTRAGGRPAVTFFDPHLPMPCLLGKVITELHRHLWKQHRRRVRSTALADPNDRNGG
jgi:hypothetical protein